MSRSPVDFMMITPRTDQMPGEKRLESDPSALEKCNRLAARGKSMSANSGCSAGALDVRSDSFSLCSRQMTTGRHRHGRAVRSNGDHADFASAKIRGFVPYHAQAAPLVPFLAREDVEIAVFIEVD